MLLLETMIIGHSALFRLIPLCSDILLKLIQRNDPQGLVLARSSFRLRAVPVRPDTIFYRAAFQLGTRLPCPGQHLYCELSLSLPVPFFAASSVLQAPSMCSGLRPAGSSTQRTAVCEGRRNDSTGSYPCRLPFVLSWKTGSGTRRSVSWREERESLIAAACMGSTDGHSVLPLCRTTWAASRVELRLSARPARSALQRKGYASVSRKAEGERAIRAFKATICRSPSSPYPSCGHRGGKNG